MISLIIPTYNEAGNISRLIPLLNKYLGKTKEQYEIIIVDDNSPDNTWQVASRYKKQHVRVIRRIGERGLSTAVLHGFKQAKGNIVGVMDADLSHPPMILPEMIRQAKSNDIVVASRYATNEKTEFTFYRKIVSKVATYMARPLTNVKDPMSGCFFFRKDVIMDARLKPSGYKILLEILVKGRYDRKKVVEVPYVFEKRFAGKSKLGLRVYTDYVQHLLSLYYHSIFRKKSSASKPISRSHIFL